MFPLSPFFKNTEKLGHAWFSVQIVGPFFGLIPHGDLWRNVLWWSGLEWVVGRVLGWVVGLACARATFNTGMFMIKLLPEHKIVYNSTKFFIDLASSFCCQVHRIDALNFKMCKVQSVLIYKIYSPGSMPRTLLGGLHRCHLFHSWWVCTPD